MYMNLIPCNYDYIGIAITPRIKNKFRKILWVVKVH